MSNPPSSNLSNLQNCVVSSVRTLPKTGIFLRTMKSLSDSLKNDFEKQKKHFQRFLYDSTTHSEVQSLNVKRVLSVFDPRQLGLGWPNRPPPITSNIKVTVSVRLR